MAILSPLEGDFPAGIKKLHQNYIYKAKINELRNKKDTREARRREKQV